MLDYAVLEWQQGNDEIAHVIAKDCSKETAELFVRISPPHLPRQVVTMDELKRMDPA